MTDMTEPSTGPHTGPSASQLLTYKEIMDIQQAGGAAFRAGQHISTCPYARGAERESSDATALRKARRLMWIRGYAAAENDRRSPSRPHE